MDPHSIKFTRQISTIEVPLRQASINDIGDRYYSKPSPYHGTPWLGRAVFRQKPCKTHLAARKSYGFPTVAWIQSGNLIFQFDPLISLIQTLKLFQFDRLTAWLKLWNHYGGPTWFVRSMYRDVDDDEKLAKWKGYAQSVPLQAQSQPPP